MPRAKKAPGAGSFGGPSQGSQPAQAPTGLPYGEHQQLVQQQQSQPLQRGAGPPAGGAPSQPAPGGAPGGPPPGPPNPLDAAAAAQGNEEVRGHPTPISRPSERPDEHMMAGAPSGPGGGPETLRPPDPLVTGAAILNALGSTADPRTAQLRARVNAQLGNQGAP